MRNARNIVIALLMISALLAGCAGPSFRIISGGNNTTIEASNAEDGRTAEVGPISVGKGKTAVVESFLDKGELKLEFAEATVFSSSDGEDEVVTGDVIVWVIVGPGDGSRFTLEKGDYMLTVTAVGTANGTVTVSFR